MNHSSNPSLHDATTATQPSKGHTLAPYYYSVPVEAVKSVIGMALLMTGCERRWSEGVCGASHAFSKIGWPLGLMNEPLVQSGSH